MAAKLLFDARLRALVAARKPAAVSDGEGLTFTLSANGVAAWTLRYRVGSRRRELTLGRYPDLSLQGARRAATVERLRVADGVDVAAEKRRSRHASVRAWTVRQLHGDYVVKVLNRLAPSTRKLWGGYLANWVLPRLGAMLVVDVDVADVVAMLRAAGERGSGAVKTLHAVTRALFEHARGAMIRADNPALGIKRTSVVEVVPTRKGAALAGDDLVRFLRAIPNDAKGAALHLHLLTGVRPAELCEAAWAEFDLEAATWRIGDERAKTGVGYTIALPAQAIELLRRIKSAMPKSAFLFPATKGEADRPIPYQTYRAWLWRAVDAAGIDRKAFKPHDLRRTLRSGLTSLGVRYEVAERAINHALPGMAEVYDRNDFAVERAVALRQWADYLDALRTGASVVPIKGRAA